MIAGIFHQGSGLGNQLARYVAIRVLAKEKGYGWGMVYNPDGSGKEEGFKGKSFMDIAMGDPVSGLLHSFIEKKVTENGLDIRSYDPEFNFIGNNTLVEGEFQDPRYFENHLSEMKEWLKTEPLEIPDDLCIVGFRGGEYTVFPDLFLRKEYWDTAIAMKRRQNPNMRFQVHTDDVATALQFFPDFECIHDIGFNWRSVRYAKHSIIANSSFYIFPRLLAHNDIEGAETIAPRYWARRNVGVWAMPSNYYRQFTYA